eukprot:1765523-Rhodomonas_salina.1
MRIRRLEEAGCLQADCRIGTSNRRNGFRVAGRGAGEGPGAGGGETGHDGDAAGASRQRRPAPYATRRDPPRNNSVSHTRAVCQDFVVLGKR